MSLNYRPQVLLARLLRNGLLCLLLLCCAANTAIADKRIALVIPHTNSKAQVIYDEILAGVKSDGLAELVQFKLTSDSTEEQLASWLKTQQPAAVIAVGKTAHKRVESANLAVPLVSGGMGALPDNSSGVALAGDPNEFFLNAKLLAPEIKRVHIVYNEQLNGWWMDRANAAANEHGIELIALRADSLKSGAKLYKKLLKSAQPSTDAIWIPLVSIVPSKTVLPMVLRKAWDKHLVVFTNSPVHAKQGALFSLYPDNLSMGKQLMELALQRSDTSDSAPQVRLAKNMKRAFNWRTASHLGLEYSLEEGAGFDRIYPVQ